MGKVGTYFKTCLSSSWKLSLWRFLMVDAFIFSFAVSFSDFFSGIFDKRLRVVAKTDANDEDSDVSIDDFDIGGGGGGGGTQTDDDVGISDDFGGSPDDELDGDLMSSFSGTMVFNTL